MKHESSRITANYIPRRILLQISGYQWSFVFQSPHSTRILNLLSTMLTPAWWADVTEEPV